MNKASRRAELVLYATEDGAAQLFLQAEDGDEGALAEAPTVKEDLTVQTEGSRQMEKQLSGQCRASKGGADVA